MKFYVGVTDKGWYKFLSDLAPEEANFWKPSVMTRLTNLQPGEPFLFKLHHPDNYIVGGGFFVQYSTLPLSMAWEVFKEGNGAPDFATFASRIGKYMG
ncbi:MAG: HNH endonuclease, partial [Candidatus Kryptoniota bacterium]